MANFLYFVILLLGVSSGQSHEDFEDDSKEDFYFNTSEESDFSYEADDGDDPFSDLMTLNEPAAIKKAKTTTTVAPTLAPCTVPGVFPINCTSYQRCSSTLMSFVYNCPIGSYFNANTLKCVAGPCLDESTTTTAPTKKTKKPTTLPAATTPIPETTLLSTTPEPETTPPPCTTEPETSTTPDPLIPQCTVEGVFPDATNCTNYYRCSPTLILFHYNCPIGSYFDETLLKCVAGACDEELPTTIAATKKTKKPKTTVPVTI